MAPDPRTPVIVGVGQINQRDAELSVHGAGLSVHGAGLSVHGAGLEPVGLIAAAARLAADDAGATSGESSLLAAIDSIRIVSLLSWRYRDPGALVATELGASPRQTAVTQPGGNSPQSLVNRTAASIAAGDLDVALIAGAECWRTRMKFRAADDRPAWTTQDESVPGAEVIGDEFVMMHPAEMARGVMLPVQVYPMFEQAVRAHEGRSIDDHLVRISELWARFSDVAAGNPAAWSQQRYTAEEIRTPGPDNRWIGFPYPKLMNSNNNVEQGAALLLCSVSAAERLGVPRDRWVFPHSGADAHDTYALSHRPDLWSSPGMRSCGRHTLEAAEVAIDDIAHIDLYSCFPSAVEIAASELGLPVDDPGRPLTVTGGLTFAGGPWNNYVTHAIAAMVGVLRDDPGSYGLCTANGGFITKHAMGVYSTQPPASGFRWRDAQPDTDKTTSARDVVDEYDGAVTIEAWTVMHDRDSEPEAGFAAALLPDGRRAWGRTNDADVIKVMLSDDIAGAPAELSPDGELHL